MKPNILYIHCHDTGRYIQPYGHAVHTPNLQRLAEDGVLFRQCFCCGPTCSPSRAALLTGQYPHSCGMLGLAHRGFSLNDYSHHIAQVLGGAGYTTALSGTQHVAAERETIGYDVLLDSGPETDPPVTQFESASRAAVDFLNTEPEEPFFLSCGLGKPHAYPELTHDARYVIPATGLPDSPEVRQYTAQLLSGVEAIDHNMGKVLDALDANGLAGNTLVVCTTDHGIAFPGMKCTLTDAGIGVMLIMRGPGLPDGGSVVDSMVSHIDVFPTLMELIGIDPPDRLQGHSLLPVLKGQEEDVREEVFAEISYHATIEPQRCVRTRRWKYIRRYDQRRTRPLPNTDDSPVKDYLLEYGLSDQPVDAEQLYDLVFDPQEDHNLATDPGSANVLTEMRQRLDRWMEETADPLRKGHVEAPEGAIITDPWETYHLSPRRWRRVDETVG